MDVIGNVYTAVQSWCKAEYCRMGYWLSAVIAYIAGPSSTLSPRRSAPTSPSKRASAPIMTEAPEVPSIIDIKRILPKHCFTPKLSLSMYYVAKDLCFVLALYGSMLIAERQPFNMLYFIWMPVYWFLQGTMFWAIFVLGHDCGHGSFSSLPLLNDVVGTALHTFIAVPFYPWKLSHKHHHKNTGNMERDEIFYPVKEREMKSNSNGKFLTGFGLGLGWITYLIVGFTPRHMCHFNPWESVFMGHVFGCVASMASMAGWAYILFLYYQSWGVLSLLVHYGAPVFVFGSWLVVVTFLHHMDTGVPWYTDNTWNNVRGQLSTVDRDYGWAHELTHNIGTHQVHHLFTKVPHYYLEDATESFRKVYPQFVRKSDDYIVPAFFRLFNVFEMERRVADDTDIHVWQGNKVE